MRPMTMAEMAQYLRAKAECRGLLLASIRDAVCLEIADELERYFAGLGFLFLSLMTRVCPVHEAIKRLREGQL